MRVALLSYNAQAGNAIGNQLREKLFFFLERQADVQLFVDSAARLHPDLQPFCQVVSRVEIGGEAWEYLSQADLVLVDYPHWYELLHFLPLLVGKRPRIILEYHGVTPPGLWQGPNRDVLEQGASERGVAWCADAVVVHSQFTRKELQEATHYPADRIKILPCVLGDLPVSSPSNSVSFRQKWGLEAKHLVLFVGRLAANKRVSVLVEALAELRERDPEVHAVLVGDNTDLYADQEALCRELAQEKGVADRLHILGQVSEEELAQAYHSADALVIPSVHEGFCVPVMEAMHAGLPVIGARAAALPETIGPAGLTFDPDNPKDLARQIRRVLPNHETFQEKKGSFRVAIVAFRFGSDIVGGAETSLRTIAQTLQGGGHQVEVFTTCARGESMWNNELAPGTFHQDGLVIHRFPIDSHDRSKHLHSVRSILEGQGPFPPDVETRYLEHSIHSTALVQALGEKIASLDAVIVGPYLFGLTWDVARAFPNKTLLLPCFHDEPLARLKAWSLDYGQVAGMLYHSPEEQEFAQVELGLNHPHAVQIGTWLSMSHASQDRQPKPRENGSQRYLVYCGRFSAQKNVPLLLTWIRQYQETQPGRFTWVFLGEGEVPLPREPWLRNLGFVAEERKQAILAEADALVQLSLNESLSLVALEAWAEGTPVVAHEKCAVLAGQIARAQGGQTLSDYASFARFLDDLWHQPEHWRNLGRQGQAWARQTYGCQQTFLARLTEAIAGLQTPLRKHLQTKGPRWAMRAQRETWRASFGHFIEEVLDADPHHVEENLVITSHRSRHTLAAGTPALLLAVSLVNRGNQVAMRDGPGRTMLCSEVVDREAGRVVSRREATRLPCLLLPGQTRSAAVTVNLPAAPGQYQVRLWAERGPANQEVNGSLTHLDLSLQSSAEKPSSCAFPFLEEVGKVLADAQRLQQLPDDYVDVTEGWLAGWKRWIKRKLLGNFKHAYVDVLSRQQSHLNQHMVCIVQNLAECCATLDHAVRGLQEKLARWEANNSLSEPGREAMKGKSSPEVKQNNAVVQ
jgi:glycosyltransferase involved in cell wall biosynthesis